MLMTVGQILSNLELSSVRMMNGFDRYMGSILPYSLFFELLNG